MKGYNTTLIHQSVWIFQTSFTEQLSRIDSRRRLGASILTTFPECVVRNRFLPELSILMSSVRIQNKSPFPWTNTLDLKGGLPDCLYSFLKPRVLSVNHQGEFTNREPWPSFARRLSLVQQQVGTGVSRRRAYRRYIKDACSPNGNEMVEHRLLFFRTTTKG